MISCSTISDIIMFFFFSHFVNTFNLACVDTNVKDQFLTEFIAKVNTLHGANIEAIYSRIKHYLEHYTDSETQGWEKF